jgi:hypothetical protein
MSASLRSFPSRPGHLSVRTVSRLHSNTASASGSFTPPTNSRLALELLNGLTQVSAHELRVQSTRSRVLDATYFFAASVGHAKGSIRSGHASTSAASTLPPSFVGHPGQREGIGLGEILDRVTMQFSSAMIAR